MVFSREREHVPAFIVYWKLTVNFNLDLLAEVIEFYPVSPGLGYNWYTVHLRIDFLPNWLLSIDILQVSIFDELEMSPYPFRLPQHVTMNLNIAKSHIFYL